MYNLLIGLKDGVVDSERMLEQTEAALRAEMISDPGYSRLLWLPTLVMPELQNGGNESPFAKIGHIESIQRNGRKYKFSFVPNPMVPKFPIAKVSEMATSFGINGDFELNRMHWAVKNVDLFRVVHDVVGPRKITPRVFTFPEHEETEPDLVAVMMPFDQRFNAVYSAIQDASTNLGMRCQRADDIWRNDHILNDVLSLLWRARVVVADLSGKNANVFYETGITHSIGRDTILITQSMDDVPFDLRPIRTLPYLPNTEGLAKLSSDLKERLNTILGRD